MESEGKQAVRALALGCAAAAAAVALLVGCRPTAVHLDPADPTSAVVVAAAWVAWLVAGGALLATAAAAAAMLPGRIGRLAGVAQPLTPRAVRRVVEVAVGGAVVVAVTAPVGAAAAPPSPPAPAPVAGSPSPLDWPGLAAPAHRLSTPTGRPRPPAAPPTEPAPKAGAAQIVVRPGDSLWSITARLLGRSAPAARVAAEWPRLYAANRAVVGADPDLIKPGQRLQPPAPDGRTTR